MKNNFLLLLLAVCITAASCAQKVTVPEPVTKAFNAKFPGATNVKWGKESTKEYEAEFKLNNVDIAANFSADGSWVVTETTINSADLPAAVTNAAQTKYPGAVYSLIEKVEKPNKTYFEIEVKVNNKKKEVEITSDGKLM
jgi:hypothetical protein